MSEVTTKSATTTSVLILKTGTSALRATKYTMLKRDKAPRFGQGSHFLSEERPEKVAQMITEWVSEL